MNGKSYLSVNMGIGIHITRIERDRKIEADLRERGGARGGFKGG